MATQHLADRGGVREIRHDCELRAGALGQRARAAHHRGHLVPRRESLRDNFPPGATGSAKDDDLHGQPPESSMRHDVSQS
jgi:hypothetical protein